jgi:hypothetical protein
VRHSKLNEREKRVKILRYKHTPCIFNVDICGYISTTAACGATLSRRWKAFAGFRWNGRQTCGRNCLRGLKGNRGFIIGAFDLPRGGEEGQGGHPRQALAKARSMAAEEEVQGVGPYGVLRTS